MGKVGSQRKEMESCLVDYWRTESPFDGMVELYWASVEDMKAQFAGPQRSIMREDEKNFIDLTEEQEFVVMEEYVMAMKSPRPTDK